MAILDNYNLRYNTTSGVLEMNTGAETWVTVPLGIVPGEIVLADTKILVGQGTGLAGAVNISGGATLADTGVLTLSNSAVIGSVLTGYVSGAGTVAATDTILQAFQKVNGNDALKLPLTGGTLIPAANSTSTFVVDTQASAKVFSVDTTNSKVLIGPTDTDTSASLTVAFNNGSGNTVFTRTQNTNVNGLSENRVFNDNGGFNVLGIGGSGLGSAFASQPYVWANNNGLMLLSTGSAQQVLFNFNVAASSGTKAIMDSTGSFTKYAGAATVGVGLSPMIAKVALTAQTADIAATTLFTAPATGLYAISWYMVTTAVDAGASAATNVGFTWTDDAGSNSSPGNPGSDLTILHNYQQFVTLVQATSGSVVQYSMLNGAPYGTARYSLYLTATRLN